MPVIQNLDRQFPGLFQAVCSVGAASDDGSASYDTAAQTYQISGSGVGIGSVEDAFRLIYREVEGDFLVTAQRVSTDLGSGTFGCMARAGTESDAAFVSACFAQDGTASLRWRSVKGGETQSQVAPLASPDTLRLERAGTRFTLSAAPANGDFQSISAEIHAMPTALRVGLFASSGESSSESSVIFRNARIEIPVWEGFERYKDYLGSRLEILDVDTGDRRIVYSTPECIEAPNWTPDGETLIFNSKGRLYRFELESSKVSEIDTGFAVRNNNDHVLSPDGSMIAISHHADEHDGLSIIYKLPVTGGTPEKLTPRGPSFLHGWSPDGQYVVYTANRHDQYDIFRVPTDGSGEELRLTDAPGLDDGPEYSPDGEWIYFNSTRSGLMQLWRMRPDGSGQEAVTDDAFNNWFAHFSPDGSRFVFLSYGQDVEADKHPYYQRVTLRLMPTEGGEAKTIAYLYGGQGTINVPSWSPDGKRVAFVSNSVLADD